VHSKALKFHLETLENPLPVGDTLLVNAEPNDYLDHLAEHNLSIITQLANTAQLWLSQGKTTQHEVTEEQGEKRFDLIIHYATKFATENIATIA